MTRDAHRSACAINRTLEVIGDRWSLLIIRDIIFAGKRHFCELLGCEEAIASNILAARLKKLVADGILTKADDPTHKQKAVYSLTERGIALLPILTQMSQWGCEQLPAIDHRPGRSSYPGIPRSTADLRRMTAALRKAHLGR